jgi:hypothetical protein
LARLVQTAGASIAKAILQTENTVALSQYDSERLFQSQSHLSALPARTPEPIEVDWITRTGDLAPLAAEWTELESKVRHRTVFSSFDLLQTWYSKYSGPYGGDPLIGLARRNGKLIGVLW